uniref:Glucuronosyltransferase n=1 Tax=Globodera rostochiensis TaxID=31243 RepID=A0A914HDZ4_GLORO
MGINLLPPKTNHSADPTELQCQRLNSFKGFFCSLEFGANAILKGLVKCLAPPLSNSSALPHSVSMETRPMPPPPPICPASLHRTDVVETCVPFAAFPSAGCQPQLCDHQQRIMGQQQQKVNVPPSKVTEFRLEMQSAPRLSQQNPPVSVSSSTCAALDYFSLFLPQHEDIFHSFGDAPPPPPSLLSGEGVANSQTVQNREGEGSYLCEDPTSSSASSVSSVPTIYSTAYSSSSAKTSATASTSSSVAAKSQDRKRPYPCSTCDSRFGSKMELEEHQNSHTGMKPFQCDVCQSRFNRRSTLWNHKRIHSDAKPFKCTVCQMQFKWKNSLKCHKEMHLRKNELTQGAMPDADSQLLTYATAAKKTIESLSALETLGASSSGAVLPPPSAMALLPHSAAPSRLLTCAGTPRKRAPPKNGGVNGKGLKIGKGNAPVERRKGGKGGGDGTTTAMVAVSGAQPFSVNLFPFGVGDTSTVVPEMVQLKKEPKNVQHAEELAALRREQALQQRHQQQFNLFPLQCGVETVTTGNASHNQQHNAPGTGPIPQQQPQHFFAPNQQIPLVMDQQHQHIHHHQMNSNNDHQLQNKQQYQQQQQLDLQLSQLVDPSMLLQDFQLAQSGTGGINGQVGMMPFLGFDLQQQLNSLTTAQLSGSEQLNNSADVRFLCCPFVPTKSLNCNSSTLPSTVSTSVSVIFSSPSVPCTSSPSFFVPSSSSNHCFANPCQPSTSTEVLLNGYHHQFGTNSMRLLSSAAKVPQQKQPINEVECQHDRQPFGFDGFCTTANGGAELEEFGIRNNGPQLQMFGQQQQHFTQTGQFGQLHEGTDQHHQSGGAATAERVDGGHVLLAHQIRFQGVAFFRRSDF